MGLAELAILALRYWKYIVAGIVMASLAVYAGVLRIERNHYKSAATEAKAKLTALVESSKEKQAALQADADIITAKYASAHADANTLAIEAARLTQEKIASDKELAATRITLNAVRMFNASKQPAPVEGSAPEAIRNDAREAGAPTPAPSGNEVSGFTLQDLLAQSARNDEEHLKCIAQVEAWQGFWRDWQAAVKRNQ